MTVGRRLALPRDVRHEAAVAGVALTALAVPASLGLRWSEAPWPLVVAAIGLGAAGLLARSRRDAVAHIAAAGVVGLFGAGASPDRPLPDRGDTDRAGRRRRHGGPRRTADCAPTSTPGWSVTGPPVRAALAVPGAVVTAGLALADQGAGPPATEAATVPVLAAGLPRRGGHPHLRGDHPGGPPRHQHAADHRHRPGRARDDRGGVPGPRRDRP